MVETFPEGFISREGTQNQIWALRIGNNKAMEETTVGIAAGGRQEVGRLASVTLRVEDLGVAEKEKSPEGPMAVNRTDMARDNSVILTWELEQGRGCPVDPSLMMRGFS